MVAAVPTLIFCAPQGIPTATHSGYGLVASSSSSSLFIAYENENWSRRLIATAGTFSTLAAKRGGGPGGSDTVSFRKNGAATALQVVTTSNTGKAQDTINTVDAAVGDYVSFDHSAAVATRWMRMLFTPTADDTQVSLFGIRGNGSGFAIGAWLASSGGTNYLPFCGGSPLSGALNTNESLAQVKLKTAGAFRNVGVFVVKNTATTAVTLRGRKNGTNGNISITIAAGATGLHRDITNTDVISIDDEYNWSVSAPSSGRVEFSSLYCEYAHTLVNGEQDIFCGRPGHTLSLPASSGSVFFTPVGDLFYARATTAASAGITFGITCGAKKFRLKVTTNTCSADQTFTVLKNGIATAVTFTVGAALTGEFIDDVNEIDLDAADTVSYQQTGGGTGALGVEYFAIVIPGTASTDPSTPDTSDDQPSVVVVEQAHVVRQFVPYERPPFIEYSVGDPKDTLPVPFTIMTQASLRVTVDGEELAQDDFTFTGIVDEYRPGYRGGKIVLDTDAEDELVRIWAEPPPSRTDDLISGELNAETLNEEFETLWRVQLAQRYHLKRTQCLAPEPFSQVNESNSGNLFII